VGRSLEEGATWGREKDRTQGGEEQKSFFRGNDEETFDKQPQHLSPVQQVDTGERQSW
jgi:hypothetical protein